MLNMLIEKHEVLNKKNENKLNCNNKRQKEKQNKKSETFEF